MQTCSFSQFFTEKTFYSEVLPREYFRSPRWRIFTVLDMFVNTTWYSAKLCGIFNFEDFHYTTGKTPDTEVNHLLLRNQDRVNERGRHDWYCDGSFQLLKQGCTAAISCRVELLFSSQTNVITQITDGLQG